MNVLKLQIIKYFIEMMINKTTPLSFILKIKVLNKTKRAFIVSVSDIFLSMNQILFILIKSTRNLEFLYIYLRMEQYFTNFGKNIKGVMVKFKFLCCFFFN